MTAVWQYGSCETQGYEYDGVCVFTHGACTNQGLHAVLLRLGNTFKNEIYQVCATVRKYFQE